MKNKLCVFDLDGTLLNQKKEILPQSYDSIERLKKHGYDITIASGRSLEMTKKYMDILGIKLPVVLCNGAMIWHQTYTYKLPMDSNHVSKIITHAQSNKLFVHLYDIDTVYTEKQNGMIMSLHGELTEEAESLEIVENLNHVEKECYKMLIPCPTEKERDELLELLGGMDEVHGFVSGGAIEIVHHHASKGSGVKKVADELGYKMADVICFGDQYNDISMFEKVGLSIAMGNGVKELKRIANYVTDTNENNGISKAIDNWLL